MDKVKVTTKNAWNRFLLSPEGMEGMLYMRERVPEVFAKEQSGIVFEAGVAQGFRRALDMLSQFTAADSIPASELENR